MSGRDLRPRRPARRRARSRRGAIAWDAAQRVLALAILAACAPLLLVLWVAVVATSGRPFLYAQERPGRGGRTIRVLKIRTMRSGADRDVRLAMAVPRDSAQVTAVGRYLRELKLDELPQLWNVVRGDMALVGPRPIAWPLHRRLVAEVVGFRDRLLVKPGVTSLSQVCILDNAGEDGLLDDWRRRTEADRHMIEHRGPAYDLVVLAMTGVYVARKVGRVVARAVGCDARRVAHVAAAAQESPVARTVARTVGRAVGAVALWSSVIAAAGCATSPDPAAFSSAGSVRIREVERADVDLPPATVRVEEWEVRDGALRPLDGAGSTPAEVAPAPDAPVDDVYRVGPADVLTVNINGEPGMTELRVPVDLDGWIQLPWIDRVQAAGHTTAELQADLAGRYDVLFHRPWVVVTVAEYRSQPVFLLGAFQDPGVVYLDRPTTTLAAIAMGDGLLPNAYLPGARILREGGVIAVDLKRLLREGDRAIDRFLRAGDTLYVPDVEDLEVFVLGATLRAGAVAAPGGHIDLLAAIAAAGGVDEAAAHLSEVRVIRSVSAERARMILVDVDQILRGDRGDFALLPGDVVYVPKSARDSWNDVVGAIAPTVGVLNSAVKPLSMFGFGEDGGGGGGKSK